MSTTATKLTEAQMLDGLKSTAKQLGFSVFHNLYAIGSEKGWPDLVIVGHGRTWFLELKGPKGHIYPPQRAWIETLQAHGHDARIVWPDDFDAVLDEMHDAFHAGRQTV